MKNLRTGHLGNQTPKEQEVQNSSKSEKIQHEIEEIKISILSDSHEQPKLKGNKPLIISGYIKPKNETGMSPTPTSVDLFFKESPPIVYESVVRRRTSNLNTFKSFRSSSLNDKEIDSQINPKNQEYLKKTGNAVIDSLKDSSHSHF